MTDDYKAGYAAAQAAMQDGHEPCGYMQKGIFVNSSGRLQVSDEQIPVFTRPPITSERELELLAEIEKLRQSAWRDDCML
jgi:hypothetical protein